MTGSHASLAATVDRDGFAVMPGMLPSREIDRLLAAVGEAELRSASSRKDGETYGMRDLLRTIPEVREAAGSASLIDLAEAILGPGSFAVRSLWFDKTDGANWGVPWHQDTTIAVRERREAEGFGPWTVKAGIPHVRPPADLSDRMVTLRIHLDDCDAENGPLKVIPGSHREGRLDARATAEWLNRVPPATCVVGLGGVVVMKPLVLHSSSAATVPRHRRVLHLEYAAQPLAGGLEWFERVGRHGS